MTIIELQNNYRAKMNRIENDVTVLNRQKNQHRRDGNEWGFDRCREEMRHLAKLMVKQMCYAQFIHDLDDLTETE